MYTNCMVVRFSIVSDRDKIFTSEFWTEFFALQGVALKMSSAYHPQSDGQTEVVNRCFETYLRCMTSDQPHMWSKWLALAEYWYNTNFHTATQMTPYEAVYGQIPPTHLPYLPGESKVAVVARSLQERENMLLLLKFHLMRAQHRMKLFVDQHRTEKELAIGDYVYVKLQPYRQQSVVLRPNQKLAPKYFGPYKILDKCGEVAYRLDLPQPTQVHPVFHVSQLKVLIGNVLNSTHLPSVLQDAFVKEPERVLERKMVNRQGKAVTKVWKRRHGNFCLIFSRNFQGLTCDRTLWSRFYKQGSFVTEPTCGVTRELQSNVWESHVFKQVE